MHKVTQVICQFHLVFMSNSMKKSGLLYFLLPVTLALWGYIIYFIYGRIFPKELEIGQSFIADSDHEPVAKDSVLLIDLQWRDPFLVKSFTSQALQKAVRAHPPNNKPATVNLPINNTLSPKLEIKKEQSSLQLKWPELIYYGWIINKTNGIKSVQLGINSKKVHLLQGEMFKDVVVTQIWEDSIECSYKQDKKIIQINLRK